MIHLKTALITVTNKGIGFEIVRQFVRKGFYAVLSMRDASRLLRAQEALASEGTTTHTLLIDVSGADKIDKLLDVLINNAAVLSKQDSSILQEGEDIFLRTIETNGYGPLCVTKAFLSFIGNGGRIINVSSGGGSMTDPVGGWATAYCTSKTFLNGISRHLAFAPKQQGISVNTVCPGWVRTEMGGAETSVWLASEESLSLTGKLFWDKKEIPW